MITATRNFCNLLDELMGVNRNGDRQDLIIEQFTDPRVCKYDLLGLCPYKLFPNTKFDLGPCPYPCCPVPPKFIKQFEEKKAQYFDTYAHQLEKILAQIQDGCDEKIAKAQQRLDVQHKKDLNKNNEPVELQNIKKEIEKVTKQIEELTTEGEYEEAQKLMERLESLKKEKETIETKAPTQKIGDTQELIVCEVCGALLSVNESDQRLADHFAGKAHLGFQRVREKLKELRDTLSFNDKRQQMTDRDHYKQMKGNDFSDFYDMKRKRPQDGSEMPAPELSGGGISQAISHFNPPSSSSHHAPPSSSSSYHGGGSVGRQSYSSGAGAESYRSSSSSGGYQRRDDRDSRDSTRDSRDSRDSRDYYNRRNDDHYHHDGYNRDSYRPQHDYRRR